MLSTTTALKGKALDGLDGDVGTVSDFYFDDQFWTIRYLVADTGDWLTGRLVLISPHALAGSHADEHISVNLSRKQVEDSPSLHSDQPVSRQFEQAYYQHHGWPVYWSGPYMWGSHPSIEGERAQRKEAELDPTLELPPQNQKNWDPHLRSTGAVTGLHIEASDGEIGHVEDFVVDSETWAIRYLIIDTRNWWSGRKVLVAPQWIERISWKESKVFVDLSRQQIRQSPEYEEGSLPSREYEAALHQHYVRPAYWVEDPAIAVVPD